MPIPSKTSPGRSLGSKRSFGILTLAVAIIILFASATFFGHFKFHLNATIGSEPGKIPIVDPIRSMLMPKAKDSESVEGLPKLRANKRGGVNTQDNLNPASIVETDSVDQFLQESRNRSAVLESRKKSSGAEEMISKIHTVTYASHGGRDDRFCRAVESAIRNDIDLIILGWGVKWTGLSQKLEAAHSFAKSLPETDVILFTDAYDVMFTEKTSVIHEKFMTLSAKTKSQIIFSAECGCWPHVMENKEICLSKYPMSPTPYRYLNSGTWIGYAKESAIMLQEIMNEAGKDFANANDQKLVADMYMEGRNGIKLDFYNEIFQSMHMTLDPPLPYCNPILDVRLTEDRKWKNILTSSTPAVFHFNGGGKSHHLDMEGKMWYQSEDMNTIEIRKQLSSHAIRIPTAASGILTFKDICGGYLNNMDEMWRNKRQKIEIYSAGAR